MSLILTEDSGLGLERNLRISNKDGLITHTDSFAGEGWEEEEEDEEKNVEGKREGMGEVEGNDTESQIASYPIDPDRPIRVGHWSGLVKSPAGRHVLAPTLRNVYGIDMGVDIDPNHSNPNHSGNRIYLDKKQAQTDVSTNASTKVSTDVSTDVGTNVGTDVGVVRTTSECSSGADVSLVQSVSKQLCADVRTIRRMLNGLGASQGANSVLTQY